MRVHLWLKKWKFRNVSYESQDHTNLVKIFELMAQRLSSRFWEIVNISSVDNSEKNGHKIQHAPLLTTFSNIGIVLRAVSQHPLILLSESSVNWFCKNWISQIGVIWLANIKSNFAITKSKCLKLHFFY